MEGVAYRGRVMVEINMELGKLPTQRVEDVKIVDQKKLTVNIMIFQVSLLYFSLFSHFSEDASTNCMLHSTLLPW